MGDCHDGTGVGGGEGGEGFVRHEERRRRNAGSAQRGDELARLALRRRRRDGGDNFVAPLQPAAVVQRMQRRIVDGDTNRYGLGPRTPHDHRHVMRGIQPAVVSERT